MRLSHFFSILKKGKKKLKEIPPMTTLKISWTYFLKKEVSPKHGRNSFDPRIFSSSQFSFV